jgi:hypothetical protein
LSASECQKCHSLCLICESSFTNCLACYYSDTIGYKNFKANRCACSESFVYQENTNECILSCSYIAQTGCKQCDNYFEVDKTCKSCDLSILARVSEIILYSLSDQILSNKNNGFQIGNGYSGLSNSSIDI